MKKIINHKMILKFTKTWKNVQNANVVMEILIIAMEIHVKYQDSVTVLQKFKQKKKDIQRR